eukprot:ctg_2924.g590
MGVGQASSSAADESPTSPQQHWLHRRTWSLPERVPGEDAVGARDEPQGAGGAEAATRLGRAGRGGKSRPLEGRCAFSGTPPTPRRNGGAHSRCRGSGTRVLRPCLERSSRMKRCPGWRRRRR